MKDKARITRSTITFGQPAENWEEALPIGNGRLGGMVFGKPYTEIIQLNEDSVWFGGPQDRNNPSAFANLPAIRALIQEGKIKEAEELCAFALSGTPEEQRHYEPLGNLYLHFEGDASPITQYSRSLDLTTAKTDVTFCMDNVTYERQIITSYPHQIMAIHLTASQPGSLSFHTQLARGNATWDYSPYQNQTYRHPGYNAYADRIDNVNENTTLLKAKCGGDGVSICCGIRVIQEGGTLQAIGNSLIVKNADEATILLAADTTFREKNPEHAVCDRLSRVAKITWQEILSKHLTDYQNLYSRVDLSLNPNEDSEIDRVTEFFFQYGRYLLIASSRPGSLPANLQGIWNDNYLPAWGSKYTININTEMNYWPAEMCNLSECHKPLFEHIKRMVPNGRETAQRMYGCRGFMAHHNTDIWGDTAPQDVCLSSTYWVMGAAWLCLHLWDHYCYTKDLAFLKEYYGIMSEAAEFLMDYLIDDGTWLVTSPTLSPENEYKLSNGEKGVICKGASMDNQIMRELFGACISAYELIKDSLPLEESVKIENMQSTLSRLAPIQVGRYGQIMEWNEDYEEIDPGHRHISQLFALYPGTQITPRDTPKLAEAAQKTIERRLGNGGGHTGWSRAWIINMWAHLENGNEALANIKALLANSTLPNMFDNHPPFQIDGNFGCTAGIAQMLVQSRQVNLTALFDILPALPDDWAEGCVYGLRIHDGITVKKLSWRNHELVDLELESQSDTRVLLRYKGREVWKELTANTVTEISDLHTI